MTASLISTLGVSALVTKAFRTFIGNSRDGPEELLAISNELSDIHLVLSSLQHEVLQSADDGILSALFASLKEAREIFDGLEPVYNSKAMKDRHQSQRVTMFQKAMTKRLREEIRALRMSLLLQLSILHQQ